MNFTVEFSSYTGAMQKLTCILYMRYLNEKCVNSDSKFVSLSSRGEFIVLQ